MRVVGFDISSTNVGISIIDSTKKKVFCTTLSRTKYKGKKFDRTLHPFQLVDQITKLVKKHNITDGDIIFVEEYNVGRTRGRDVVPWVQGFIIGVLAYHLGLNKIFYVHQTDWKEVLRGRGAGGKEGVEEETYIKCKDHKWKLDVEVIKEDTFDAFGVAYFGYQKQLGNAKVSKKRKSRRGKLL